MTFIPILQIRRLRVQAVVTYWKQGPDPPANKARKELLGPSPASFVEPYKAEGGTRGRESKMDAFRKGSNCFQGHCLPTVLYGSPLFLLSTGQPAK